MLRIVRAMPEEIARNQRRSVIVIVLFVLVWVGIGALLGALLGGSTNSRGSAIFTGVAVAGLLAVCGAAFAWAAPSGLGAALPLASGA